MEAEDVARACDAIRAITRGHSVTPVERGSAVEHVAWMLDRIDEFMLDGRREKAMRWLGFAQGVVWSWGWFDVDELKAHNRPCEAAQ